MFYLVESPEQKKQQATIAIQKATPKNFDILSNKHSQGEVAYFIDIVDTMVEDVFHEEAEEAFEAYRNLVISKPPQ